MSLSQHKTVKEIGHGTGDDERTRVNREVLAQIDDGWPVVQRGAQISDTTARQFCLLPPHAQNVANDWNDPKMLDAVLGSED